MEIFWRRYEKEHPPWTDDPVLDKHKFTNVYRVLDRSSQHLVSNVIYNGKKYNPEDMFLRILLYKHFNLPDTWDWLMDDIGDITLDTPQEEIVNSLKQYSKEGYPVYSNAFMLTAPFMKKKYFLDEFGLESGMPKFKIYTNIFYKEFFERGKVIDILESKSFKGLFDVFMSVPSFADFLSYQFTQDVNYSELVNFDMNEFCAPGNGTIRGIERTFDLKGRKIDYGRIVIWVYENLDKLIEEYSNKFDIDLSHRPLPNLPPQTPDLSNCFCETDKLMRGMGVKTEGKEIKGKRIKQTYNKGYSPEIEFKFPPKWGVKLK